MKYTFIDDPTKCPCRASGNHRMGRTCGFDPDKPTFPCFDNKFAKKCYLTRFVDFVNEAIVLGMFKKKICLQHFQRRVATCRVLLTPSQNLWLEEKPLKDWKKSAWDIWLPDCDEGKKQGYTCLGYKKKGCK